MSAVGPATAYAAVTALVDNAIDEILVGNDPTVVAYLFARAGLVRVSAMRGPKRAAELAYRLADEFSTGAPT